MRRKAFIFAVSMFAVTALCVADGPYSMSVGSGDGSLALTKIHSLGFIDSGDGTYDPPAHASGGTVWQGAFLLYDVTNDQQYFMDSETNFTGVAHDNRPTEGTINTGGLPTNFTNTGIGFPNTSGLTADLSVTLSAPTPGDTAQLDWAWTLNNGSASTLSLRLIWFLDADLETAGTAYTDDLVAFTISGTNGGVAIAMGEDATGSVDLDRGILMDASVAPDKFVGFSDAVGPSSWWGNSGGYAGAGVEVTNDISATYHGLIHRNAGGADANADGLADSTADSGGALQFDLSIAPGDNAALTLSATWGLNQTVSAQMPSKVKSWSLY